MVRDVRQSPRGLIAPLTQAMLATLRNLHEGWPREIPEDHRTRLLDLGLVDAKEDGLVVTALGRERLISDR